MLAFAVSVPPSHPYMKTDMPRCAWCRLPLVEPPSYHPRSLVLAFKTYTGKDVARRSVLRCAQVPVSVQG
jgi:hypothetical protein